jgi:hypothetical protein
MYLEFFLIFSNYSPILSVRNLINIAKVELPEIDENLIKTISAKRQV